MHLSQKLSFGVGLLLLYFLVTLGIGYWARRRTSSADAYLNAGRSLPLWIVVLAYIAANCGALDIVGMSAMAAQYGAKAFHFYWVGAIPAMIFLALWMMPIYRSSGVRSVPEFLEARFGPRLRFLNACSFAIMTLLLSGIGLYAVSLIIELVTGLSFSLSVTLAAAAVLIYILIGGIKATIYNAVFQLAVMIAGIAPIGFIAAVHLSSQRVNSLSGKMHLWKDLPLMSPGSPMDAFGTIVGLGFVLGFGYWCTDFVMMQRAFTARTDNEARQVPLWAGFGKLIFSFLVVLPGLAGTHVLPELGRGLRFDQVLPLLMARSYGPLMLSIGFTALIASLFSGIAANISAFASLWTEDIYRRYLQRSRPETHYVLVGRLASAFAVTAAVAASSMSFLFGNLMEHIQLIFSIFNAPFWAVFLLGISSRKTTERGALLGFVCGTAVSLLHLLAFSSGHLHYGSTMTANFYAAIFSFTTALLVGWLSSTMGNHATNAHLAPVSRIEFKHTTAPLLWGMAIVLFSGCLALNLLWR